MTPKDPVLSCQPTTTVPQVDSELCLVDRLRARSRAVFLAAEASPAQDLSNHLKEAAARIEELEAALRDCRTSYNGYAITNPDQYPDVLARFWKELSRIDKTARAALEPGK